jgi:hypothetical protein
MRTELIYVSLDDARLTALAQESDATGLTVEELVQAAVSEFLDERRGKS